MVMVGGVEIAVDLNLEGIEQTLKGLEKQFNSTKFGVNVGIDASAYNKLQQDINRVRDRVVVKKICVPIDICDDSINKVERKFYAIKRKLENNPINIKVNYSQQKGGFSGSGSAGKVSGIDKSDIKNIGRDIVDELKALRKDVISGFGNSVSSTNNTTSAIGPIRMIGSVVSELKTISKNTKKQGLISSLVGSAIDGFVIGAMNKSGAKFSENFNKILNKNVAGQISKTQSRIKQSQENIGNFQSSIRTSQRLVDDGKRQRPLVQESIARKQEQVLQKREQIKLLDQEKNTALFPQTKAKIDAQIEIEKNIINQINEQIQLEKQFIEVIDIQSKRETESIYRMVDKIKAEEAATKKLSQELKKLETKLDDSFDFLGGKQLAVKAIRLKKFGDSVAKNVFAFNDLKEVKDVTLDAMGTLFNAFTDEKFYKEMEDTYVDYMQQVEILGKDAKAEQEKAIKRLTGRFDRVSERVSARAIGGTLKSVAQPLRVNKRVMTANSAKMIKDQLPYMGNVIAERKEAMGKADQILLFMGGVQPMDSKPGEPMVGSTHTVGNILGGTLTNTFVEKVTNEISNAVETIDKSPTFGARKMIGQFMKDHKDTIDKMFPGNTIAQDMAAGLNAHPIDRAIQVNFQGFDEDAIKLAMRALTIAQEFPDKKIALMGGSGGGFAVEEAISIIEQFIQQYPEMAHLAKNIVGGIGLGTPNFNLTSTAPVDKFKYVLGSQDHFNLGVLGHTNISPQDPQYNEILSKLPGGMRMPTGAIRPGANFVNLPGEGFDHNIGQMALMGYGKPSRPLAMQSDNIFGEGKMAFPPKPGYGSIYEFKNEFGSLESALWHLTEKGQANKWYIDEALTMPLDQLKKVIQTPDEKFNFENGIRLQQTWFASRKNLIRGGYNTPEGKELEGLLDRVGDEIAKLNELGYKGSLFKIVVKETKPDQQEAKAEGFKTRKDAEEWVKENVSPSNLAETEITPHYGDVLYQAQGITKDHLLPEVISRFNEMPSSTPLEKQLKNVVGAFIDFQKKDLALYKKFLQDVLSLRERIGGGDESAKTELVQLLKSSAFSVIKGKIEGSPLSKEATKLLKGKTYATYPGMSQEGITEIEATTQQLMLEYISTGGTVTDDIKTKATELVETYKFLSDGLNSLYKTIKNEPPLPVPDSSFINDPTSFQSLLNLNTKLPEQYQLNPYSSKVLGEGFNGRAIGDIEKGIVLKYPKHRGRKIKIATPEEIAAQQALSQKGLSPAPIPEASKEGEYLTTTFVKGVTLQSIRDTVDSNKLKKIAKLLVDIHKEGWVHLDMALANIMETETGDLVAIDFANAKKATKDLMKLDLERVIERSRLSGPQTKELTAFYQEEIKDFLATIKEVETKNKKRFGSVMESINNRLPQEFKLDPNTTQSLGRGMAGQAFLDTSKGIVLKHLFRPKAEGKIATPLEMEAMQHFAKLGMAPTPIPEASKQGHYMAMSLIKGKTLQSQRGKVDSEMMKKVAKLMADIHKEGWVHLDLNLANIIETESGKLVAIDFAFAQKATEELMQKDIDIAIKHGKLNKSQQSDLKKYYKEYMDQISAVPMPDTSNITQEVEKVQQTVSSGIAGTVKKYLEDLGKEIYALGLNKTLDKSQAQEAVKRIDAALEGLNRLKEVLPDKIPNSKGRLAPKGNVINGYASLLKQSKSKILAGGDEPINIKLPDFSKLKQNILDGLELDGGDTSQLREFADSITEPAKEKIKENWDIHSPSGFTEWCKDMLIAGLELTGQDKTKIEEIGEQISSPLKKSLAIITPAPRAIAGLLPSSEMLKKAKEDYLMEWVSFLQDIETVRMRYDFETAWQKSNTTKLLPPAKESTKIKPLVTPAPKQITGLLPSVELANSLRAINETMQMISILQDTEMVRMRFDLDTNWNKGPSTKFLPPAEGFTPIGLLPGSLERKGMEDSLTKIYKEIIKLLPSIEELQKEQEKSNIGYLIDFLKSTDIVQARFNLDQSWANPQNSTLSLPTRDTSLAGFLPSSEIIEQRRLREKQLIQQQRESQRGIVSTAAEIFPPEALNNLITVSTQRLLPSAELRQKEAESRIQSLREIANVARELNGLVEVLPFRNEAIVTSPNTLATRDATADQEEKRQVVTLAREFFDPRVFGRTSRDTVEEQNREIRALPGFGFRQNNDQAPGPRQSSLDGAINFFGPPAMLATSIGVIVSFREQLMALGAEALAVATRFEVLTNTLNYLSGGTGKGAEKFEQLSGLANKLGVDFESLITSYNRLAASTRLTPLEGTTTDLLTEGIAQAGKTFGMSSEEMAGSLLAVSQIAGKGVVSAEELRGQLAERIPGAFQVASRAMKMTEKELFQLMATGQLASTDFLPKFAKQLNLESAAGVTGSASGAISAMNRLQNSITELHLELGKILLPIQTFGLQVANVFVGILGDNVGTILKRVTLAMTGFLVGSMPFGAMLTGWVVNLKNLALSLGGVQVLLKMLKEGIMAVVSSLARVLAVVAAKALIFSAMLNMAIDSGVALYKLYSKTSVWDEWAKSVEYNAKRVQKAFKELEKPSGIAGEILPENKVKRSGIGFFDMNADRNSMMLRTSIELENKRRLERGDSVLSGQELEDFAEKTNKLSRQLAPTPVQDRMDENAKIKRDEMSRMVDTVMMAPIQNAIELFQQKQGPLMEASTIDAIVKSKKARLSVLGPTDTEESSQLKREISTAEERRNSVMAPYESAEGGLRESLRQDQEKLAQYEQALRDQTSGDADKRKKAEDFLRSPGIDEASMQIVKENIRQTTDALIAYDKEMAKAGLISDTQKLAKAMMELSVAFQSVETRLNNVHLNKLKAITQGKVKGFSSDRFNLENTAIKEAEENYNNTNRQIKERQKTIKQLEDDLALNPAKESADQLILNEETRKGRKLTPEEIGIVSKTWGEGNEQLKQALDAEAIIRQEKIKTGEMEKQSAEELYAIREARQAHYLAIYEDAIDEIKQLDQRNLSNAMTGANNQLARGLRSDLGAEDAFNVKTTGMQYIKVQKDIENNALAMKSLQQAYYEGKLSLEQYTTKSRALLTEDAQLKQQLVEQEISYIKAVSQARMNALQRIKESRDANTEIANSGRTEAITKNSISKFRTDEFLSNNESLAQAKNGLVEIQNQLKNTNSELSELEEAYAGGKGPLLLNDYIQKKRQLLITQAQQESQLATAEMARMRAIEDYRLAMLDRMRDVSNNKNAILNAEALTQLAQSQMTGQVGDSQASRQSTEIALDNAKKSVEVAKESLTQIQNAYRKKELSAEKYQERLRAINLEIAQANQSVAEQELALWKAKEQEKISILEKSLERQDRLNKLNAIKTKINNTEQLAGMLASGGTSDLTSSIFSSQETNVSQDQLISSLTNKLAGLKGIVNPTKDLQDKILTTEQELNEAVLTKRLNLLSQSLEYKKQMLNATQLENKSIENQLNMIDSQHKLQQAFVEITKKRLENEIVSMERIKTLSDEIGSSSIESVQFRSQFDDVIATKRLKTLDIELKANVRNLEIEQHREKLSQRKAENESRLAVIQAKNSLLIANQSGNSDAIALAQQQFQLANESLSTVLQQGQAMNQLHDTQKTKLSLEHQGTLQAEKYAKIQDTINSKLKTANSYLDKQKERLDSINELNKAINNARTNVLEKQTGISDRKIDLYDAINGTEKITDPKQNAVLMKELEAQLKAIGGSTDPEAMYAERLRLEESLANQKMNALVAEQNMQKTLLQIEFDKYELQAQALILQTKMLALQSKGTENEASANQLVQDAMNGLDALQNRRQDAMEALGINQETERYNQGIENANAINDARRKSAEAGYRPKGDPVKYPTATGEAGKTIKELLTGNSQRFGYAPSFDLNQAVKGLRGGNGIDIGRVNIPSPSNEPTYTPLNINEELLTPNLTENTERNTKAMYDLSNSIISLTEALVNNKPGLEINAPVANNNPVSTPTGQPTTTGGQQVINNVNYGGVTVISSDPTGDARKVLNDLAKANKNRL